MSTDEIDRLFEGISSFGWHHPKAAVNLRIHKINFEDVKGVFDGYTFIRRSDRHGEIRYQIFGYIDGREVAVACALRGPLCWIISARRARKDERAKYYDRFAAQLPKR